MGFSFDANAIRMIGDALSKAMPEIQGQGVEFVLPGGLPGGMLVAGNINLNNRPTIDNGDGTQSSEYSASMNDPGVGEVLFPTIVNGKFLTPDGKKPPEGSPEERAMIKRGFQHYKETGEQMGIFNSVEHANAYAEAVHLRGESKPQGQGLKQPAPKALPIPKPPTIPKFLGTQSAAQAVKP